MSRRLARNCVQIVPGLIASLLLPAFAFAQPAETEAVGIQEIIVTAQKREERLQEVPVAITALNSEQLETRGITNIMSLSSVAPNLQITQAAGSQTAPQLGMRGSLQINGAIVFDSSVGLYVDGVFIAKASGSILEMANLERVEVLRGPQGTLYGRNTLAGAINLVTKAPTGEFGGDMSISLGNFGAHVGKLNVDLPQYGIMKAAFSVRTERRDGWVDVKPDPNGIYTFAAPIPDTFDKHQDAARIALDFDFTDTFKVQYRYDITKVNQNHVYDQLVRLDSDFGYPSLLSYVVPRSKRAESYATDLPTAEDVKVYGHSVTMIWDATDTLQFKSISAYRAQKYFDFQDLDGTPADLATASRTTRYHAFSQEFQATGSIGERFNYVAGLFYSDDDGWTHNVPLRFFGGFVNSDSYYGGGAKSYAAYTQVDFKPIDQVTLTAGLRYTKEKKDFRRYLHQLALPGAEISGDDVDPVVYPNVHACEALNRNAACSDADFNATTPAFSAAWRPTENINLYARYAEGFKSGGFNGETNLVLEVNTPYRPEKLKSYELGAKTRFLDGRAQVNVALFENKSTDLQTAVFLGSGTVASVVKNAGKATVKGVEVEGILQLSDAWRVDLNYGYLDPKFDEFQDAVCPSAGDPDILVNCNVANNRAFPHAPKHTLNVTLDGRLMQTSYGTLRGLVDYNYTAENYYYPYPLVPELPASQQVAKNTLVGSRGIVNGKLMLQDIPAGDNAKAEISLWIRNAFDKEYVENIIDFGPSFANLTIANFGTPRTYGAEFTVKW